MTEIASPTPPQRGPLPQLAVRPHRWRSAKKAPVVFREHDSDDENDRENVAALRSSRAIPRESIEASARTSRPSATSAEAGTEQPLTQFDASGLDNRSRAEFRIPVEKAGFFPCQVELIPLLFPCYSPVMGGRVPLFARNSWPVRSAENAVSQPFATVAASGCAAARADRLCCLSLKI